MHDREDIFEDYTGDTSRANLDGDEYARGWTDSDEAIRHQLCGAMSYSQGETDWDRGWNARIAQEWCCERLVREALERWLHTAAHKEID